MPEVRALEPRSPSFSFITLIHYNRHGTTDAEILSAFSPMGVCVWNRPATRRERTNDIHQILYLILSVLTHQSYTAHDSGVPASKIRSDRLVSRATHTTRDAAIPRCLSYLMAVRQCTRLASPARRPVPHTAPHPLLLLHYSNPCDTAWAQVESKCGTPALSRLLRC